ncbi:MAG: hypothetical protein Q9191_008308, partial [Dirinaria sp. TL-2023a]
MMGFGLASKALAAAVLYASAAIADVDPIVIKGSKFFYKTNGTEFFIQGVAYQQDFSSNGTISGTNNYKDPLADPTSCTRDIPLLQQLKTNTIRVYAVDPTKDHDQCMSMLQDAGIYVVMDLGEPATSINRDSPEWDLTLYNRYTSVVDTFQKYNNLLGFFAGNEVSNAPNNTIASAFVKAAVRDTKAYIAQKKYRTIGVGYATNDDDTRTELADYFNCGPQQNAIDFWGYNIYSWCGHSSYTSSKYDVRTEEFSTYSVPAFFAEYGCITPPRLFTEVGALFGSKMTPVWSGGIVYMYFEEANNYGLVTIGSDNKATKRPDFSTYSSQIASVTPSGVSMGSYNPTNSPQACPSVNGTWEAEDTLPPTPNAQLCGCMVANLTCVAKPSISDDAVEATFNYLCDPKHGDNCGGITPNATLGKYGAYSMCNATERLSWAMNEFYFNEKAHNPADTQPCNFNGNATTQTPKLANNCKALVSQAGAAGTGTVTSAPTGTGSAGGAATTSKKSAAGANTVPKFDFGLLQLAIYVVTAGLVGAGMVLL